MSLVKGVSSHLQCPGCSKLIEDPRILTCAHTYCRSCLDKAVRKTVSATSPNTTTSTATSASSASASNSSSLEPYLLDYDLRRILGSSLNKELETSLSKILDPHFTGLEASAQKTPAPKPTTPKSQKKKGSGKSKGGSKSQEPSAKTTTQAASQGATKSTTTPGSVKKTEPEASRADPDSSKAQASKNSTMEVLVCPECGSHTEIPGGNISLIPYNFFMQHIMDLMTYYSSREPVPLVYCSMCRKDGLTDLPPAVARCSTCASFLCKQCYELHSIDDFTKLHSTLSITERGESSIFSCLTPDDTKVRNCKGHGWKPFVYFCITCSKGICEVCSKQDHKTHLFAKPEVLRPDYVAYIHDLMSRTTQLRRRTESAVRTTQELMSGIQLLAATQIEEVLRTQGLLSSSLDTRLEVLLREADSVAASGSGANKRAGKRT